MKLSRWVNVWSFTLPSFRRKVNSSTGEVFCVGMVVDAVDVTLHDRPDTLHTVRCDALAGVFTRAMVHNFVDVVVA